MANQSATLRRPTRRLTQAELDAFLEKAADILRGNVDHSEFRAYVFALLFFKRISDVYVEEVAALAKELGDEQLAKDPRLHNFVVPDGSQWPEVARKSRNELGTALNEAMISVERSNQPKFDGILTNKVDFNKSDELPREKLINLVNHFSSQVFDRAHVSDDVFGDAYEYLIRNFASKAGKSSGEFYTPREVAYLMAEMIDPQPDQTVCDWASGSGGLLLQCRNYVRRERSLADADRLHLYAQEGNVTTYNISRINMILHGVKGWRHEQGDSLRTPRLLNVENGELLLFDRIVMNPPFSLEDWGFDDLASGDSFNRFDYGMPPRDNGDYAWLQQVLKSLRSDGKAVIVMSQGVLFRGQPEQTEADDGRNQKADAEFVIRKHFIDNDFIECIIVLPPKLFYGNSVPGCLIVLNKNKVANRRDKVLLIWASRDFAKGNPQNLLRPSDLMRILVPWRAFGDLKVAQSLIVSYERRLIAEEQAELARRLADIDEAFSPITAALETAIAELELLNKAPYKEWVKAPVEMHPFFGALHGLEGNKAQLRAAEKSAKDAYKARTKELARDVKAMAKLAKDGEYQIEAVRVECDREIKHVTEAAAELHAICSDPGEAQRYFSVANLDEIIENEFNLNLPRYVETFDKRTQVNVQEAFDEMTLAIAEQRRAEERLSSILAGLDLRVRSASDL